MSDVSVDEIKLHFALKHHPKCHAQSMFSLVLDRWAGKLICGCPSGMTGRQLVVSLNGENKSVIQRTLGFPVGILIFWGDSASF